MGNDQKSRFPTGTGINIFTYYIVQVTLWEKYTMKEQMNSPV